LVSAVLNWSCTYFRVVREGNAVGTVKPSYFAEAILTLGNKPFSLAGRNYLRFVHDSIHPNIILRTGRQVEKSTTLAVHMLTRALLIPYFNALYVSPSSKQTRIFSSQKLNTFISGSKFIQQFYLDSSCVDRVFEKSFTNQSRIVLDYVYNTPDRVRGISADSVYVDEVQDIPKDFLPVIFETMSHSQYKWRLLAGTPKRYQNTIEYYWGLSSQTEYAIKCDSCGHWNILDERNVAKEGLVCSNCHSKLNLSNGQWVNTKRDFTFKGIRIPQLIVPWIKWKDIWEKHEEYSSAQFYNEVLGMPYEDAARPFTKGDLIAACENRPFLNGFDGQYFSGERLYLGIDYAPGGTMGDTAYTVVVIGGFVGDVFKVVYAKRYKGIESDLTDVAEDVVRLVKQFNVALVGADWGIGSGGTNQLLRKMLGSAERVVEFYHSGSQNALIKWDSQGYKFTLNRTDAMSTVMLKIKEKKITFPKWEYWEPFADDFLNIYQDYSEASRRIIYDHESTDDTFHALLFAYFVGLMEKGMLDKYFSKVV